MTVSSAISQAYSFNIDAVGTDPGSISHSAAVNFTALPVQTFDFTLSATPPSVTVSAGKQLALYSLDVSPNTGSFPSSVTFSCSKLPALTTCTFNPTQVGSGSGDSVVTLTITTTAAIPASAKVACSTRYDSPSRGHLLDKIVAGCQQISSYGKRPSPCRSRNILQRVHLGIVQRRPSRRWRRQRQPRHSSRLLHHYPVRDLGHRHPQHSGDPDRHSVGRRPTVVSSNFTRQSGDAGCQNIWPGAAFHPGVTATETNHET